uniref:Endonuclease/exonuclease/phosphatase domain-containing protein n=1 Tax=Latimeria chalumnae TaxID=7897 RepID=H3ARY9_LATCH
NRPRVPGMTLAIERPHNQYDSAIFVKPGILINFTSKSEQEDIKILTVDLKTMSITSVYKPPAKCLRFPDQDGRHVIISDFNCHNTRWGYNENNENSEFLEKWADAQHLSLIHDPKLPSSFNSERWKHGYNPDLIFVSASLATISKKLVLESLPQTQHRPIGIQVHAAIQLQFVPFRQCFNFKKANWSGFSNNLDATVNNTKATPQNYQLLVTAVRQSVKKIPRGCRTSYIPGLTQSMTLQFKIYKEKFKNDPFAEDTIATGEKLMSALSKEHRRSWQSLIESTDMTHNSKKAWEMIRKLTNDPQKGDQHYNVTANQVTHQLILNTTKQPELRLHLDDEPDHSELTQPFSLEKLNIVINTIKTETAAGLDDIRTEQIKHFGPATCEWLLKLFTINFTFSEMGLQA